MGGLEQIMDMLPLLIPIIVIDLGFRIYALIDILKPERKVRGDFNGNKVVWILVSCLINFGWVVYFLFGRDE